MQFTLTQAASIESIEGWVVSGIGGSMNVKIRENINGLPSLNAPPLRSPNSIYSKRYDNLPTFFNGARWLVFQQYEAVLAPGTYWVTFEPVHASGLNYTMAGQTPNPLAKYAFHSNGNSGYVALNQRRTRTTGWGLESKAQTSPGSHLGQRLVRS